MPYVGNWSKKSKWGLKTPHMASQHHIRFSYNLGFQHKGLYFNILAMVASLMCSCIKDEITYALVIGPAFQKRVFAIERTENRTETEHTRTVLEHARGTHGMTCELHKTDGILHTNRGEQSAWTCANKDANTHVYLRKRGPNDPNSGRIYDTPHMRKLCINRQGTGAPTVILTRANSKS